MISGQGESRMYLIAIYSITTNVAQNGTHVLAHSSVVQNCKVKIEKQQCDIKLRKTEIFRGKKMEKPGLIRAHRN